MQNPQSLIGPIVISYWTADESGCYQESAERDGINTCSPRSPWLLRMGCCKSKESEEKLEGDTGNYIAKQDVTIWDYSVAPDGSQQLKPSFVKGNSRLEVKKAQRIIFSMKMEFFFEAIDIWFDSSPIIALPCKSLPALVEFCTNFTCQSCNMDFSKFF